MTAPAESAPRMTVIIAASPRSGSYLLCDLLHATGHLPLADEWLSSLGRDSRCLAYGLPGPLPNAALHPHLLRREQNARGIVALKTVWTHFRAALEEVTGVPLDPEAPTSAHVAAAAGSFPHPRYLWIRRRDYLGSAISCAKAEQNGQWRATGEEAKKAAPLLFSAHAVFAARVHHYLNELAWERFFQLTPEPPCTVDYDELVRDPTGTVATACEYLGLPPPPPLALPGGPQRDAVNAVWREAYHALEAVPAPDDPLLEAAMGAGDLEGLPAHLTMTAGTVRQLELTLHNRSDRRWLPRVGSDGFHGPTIQVWRGDPGTGEAIGWGEVHSAVDPGTRVPLALRLAAPTEAGDHRLTWVATSAPHDPAAARLLGESTLEVVEAPALRACAEHFATCTVRDPRWREVPWLGAFVAEWFPFLVLPHHGWWYFDPAWPEARGELRLHDVHLGWLRTTPATYPTLRRESDGRRFHFLRREGDERLFTCGDHEGVLRVPVCEATHIEHKPSHLGERGLLEPPVVRGP
jgi:trehalose 2-sulfotransferase